MATARPLRIWLALRIALAAVLPLALVGALVVGVVLPQLRADLGISHDLLARAIVGQIETHLLGASRELHAIADDLRIQGRQSASFWSVPLDAHVGSGEVFAAIYIVDANHSVYAVGLPRAQRGQRNDLLGLDLSKRPFMGEASQRSEGIWSATFLSTVTGRLAVSLAIPADDQVLVGEIALDRLSGFLGRSRAAAGMMTMILDRQGQIIAHSQAAFGGQRLRLGHLPIVRDALEGNPATGDFEINGELFLGTPVSVPRLGWIVLVAQPQVEALRPFMSTMWVLAASALAALMMALAVALGLARGLARRIGHYADQAHAIADGDYDQPRPASDIRELDGLGADLERMALAIRERERDLAVSEARYRSVISNAPVVIFQFDERGIFTLSEGKALARVGLAPGQAVGQSLFDLYHNHPEVCDYARRAIDGESSQYVLRVGGAFFDTYLSPARDSRGHVQVMGVSVDITDRHQAEESLRESEARLRSAIESVPFDFFLIAPNGRYLLQNSASIETWGDVVGRRPEDITDDTAMLAHWNDNNRRAFAGEIVKEEVRVVVADGERWIYNIIAPVKDRDEVKGIVGLNIDISERKRAEQALQQSETKYRRLHESMRDAFVSVDLEGTIQEYNPAYQAMLGYPAEELRRLTYRDLTPEKWHAIEQDIVDHQVLTRGYSEVYEKEYRRRDGSVFPVELRTFLIRDSDDHPASMWAIVRDITERRQAEEALRSSNRQLRMLSDCQLAMTRITDEIQLLTTVCNIAVQEGGYRMAWVGYAECDGAKSLRAVAHAGFEDGYLQSASMALADDERDLIGNVIGSGRPCLVQNIASDSRFASRRTEAAKRGYASMCALPLGAGDRTLGTLGIYASTPEAFDTEEIKLLSELASDLAFGITALRTRIENDLANAALKQNEFLLRRSQEVGELGSYYFDTQKDTWISSEKLDQIFGIDSAFQKTTGGWIELVHPDDREEMIQHLTAYVLAQHNRFDREYRIVRHNDGQERWVHGLGELEFDESGKPIRMIGTVQDITRSKLAEQRLLESEHKYRELVENANSIILRWTPEGRITFINEFGLRFFGYSGEELIGRHVIGTIVPHDESTGRDLGPMMEEICRDPERFERNVNENMRRDGSRVWVAWTNKAVLNEQGEVVEVFSVGSDITERKRMEQALQESEERLRQVVRVSQLGIFDQDHQTGRIYWSPEQRAIHGWDADEPVTLQAFLDSVHPDDHGRIAAALRRARDPAGDGLYDVEHRILRNGEIRWIVTRSQTFFAGEGATRHPVRTVGADLDITERQRANQELQRHREHLEEIVAERTAELRQAMRQLMQSEKLAALGNLVAGMAHELNTPLGNARVVASSLGEEVRAFAAAVGSGGLRRSRADAFFERSREAIDLLERNTARAADLIGHFKQVAVDQASVRRRQFSLGQIVGELLATLQPQFKHTAHRVELDIPAELQLDSYPGPLEQVLANLVVNSLTHGFAGIEAGIISIRADSPGAGRIQIEYADNGVGIPAGILRRIFDPFFTTKLGSGGSGLGLYIVYNLVTGLLGGTVEAHSVVGQGVRFVIALPQTAPDQPPVGTPA